MSAETLTVAHILADLAITGIVTTRQCRHGCPENTTFAQLIYPALYAKSLATVSSLRSTLWVRRTAGEAVAALLPKD
jgi:hypothetical protein